MKKTIMVILIAGILLTGVLPMLQEIQPDLFLNGGGHGGSGDPTPGKIDFCGEIFNPLDGGPSPDGGGGCGSGDPTPG